MPKDLFAEAAPQGRDLFAEAGIAPAKGRDLFAEAAAIPTSGVYEAITPEGGPTGVYYQDVNGQPQLVGEAGLEAPATLLDPVEYVAGPGAGMITAPARTAGRLGIELLTQIGANAGYDVANKASGGSLAAEIGGSVLGAATATGLRRIAAKGLQDVVGAAAMRKVGVLSPETTATLHRPIELESLVTGGQIKKALPEAKLGWGQQLIPGEIAATPRPPAMDWSPAQRSARVFEDALNQADAVNRSPQAIEALREKYLSQQVRTFQRPVKPPADYVGEMATLRDQPVPVETPEGTIFYRNVNGRLVPEFSPRQNLAPGDAVAAAQPRPEVVRHPVAPEPQPLPKSGEAPAPGSEVTATTAPPEAGATPGAPKAPDTIKVPAKGTKIGKERVRSGAVSLAQDTELSPRVREAIAETIKPGGKGVYVQETIDSWEKQADNILERLGPENAETWAKAKNGPVQNIVGFKLIRHYSDTGNPEKAASLAQDLMMEGTKQGRSVVSWRYIDGLSPEAAHIFTQKTIKKINEKLPRWMVKRGKEVGLSPETAQKVADLFKAMREATDPRVKEEISQEIQGLFSAMVPVSLGRKVATAQVIAQLANPKTQVRNILGNELFYRLERLNKLAATPVDWAVSKLTSTDRTITWRTAGQKGFWDGFFRGAKAGWKGVNPKGLQTRFDLPAGLAFRSPHNPLHWLERSLYATMKGFDFAAYNRAYNQTLGELATLKSINTLGRVDKNFIAKALENVDDNMIKLADDYGKYVTFQGNNIISKGLRGLKRVLNLNKDFGLGDMVIKYPSTPGALLHRGLEYSPAGFLRSAYQLSRPFLGKAGKELPSRRDILMGLSRAITGTLGLTGMGYALYDMGILSGGADEDKDIAAMDRAQGIGPYRVNLSALTRFVKSGYDRAAAAKQPGDKFVSWDWLQPVAFGIAIGSNLGKAADDAQKPAAQLKSMLGQGSNILANTAIAAFSTLLEQPVLQGVVRAFRGYKPEDMAGSLVDMVAEVPASFTPTLLSQIRYYMDGYKRSTYAPNKWDRAWNKVANKIPGMDKALPLQYDNLGVLKKWRDNNWASVFLSPAIVEAYAPLLAEERIRQAYEATGDQKVFPRAAGKQVTLPFMQNGKLVKQRVYLTGEEWAKLQKVTGSALRNAIERIPDNIPPADQARLISALQLRAGLRGRAAIYKQVLERVRKQIQAETKQTSEGR